MRLGVIHCGGFVRGPLMSRSAMARQRPCEMISRDCCELRSGRRAQVARPLFFSPPERPRAVCHVRKKTMRPRPEWRMRVPDFDNADIPKYHREFPRFFLPFFQLSFFPSVFISFFTFFCLFTLLFFYFHVCCSSKAGRRLFDDFHITSHLVIYSRDEISQDFSISFSAYTFSCAINFHLRYLQASNRQADFRCIRNGLSSLFHSFPPVVEKLQKKARSFFRTRCSYYIEG